MNKKIIPIIGGVFLVLCLLAFVFLSDNPISNKISPISIISLSDENSSIVITKNNLDKTANVNMKMYINPAEEENTFFGEGFMASFTTKMGCGLMSMAFFNETAVEEFNQAIQEWNSMNGTVTDEEGKELGKPEPNPLEGYEVKQVQYYVIDINNQKVLGECSITGYGSDFIKMKIDGKEVGFEDELENDA